jgi:hypothetical protein
MTGPAPIAQVLKLREAARLIGVSPGRLYRAIAAGRLTAAPGGGPGKSTLVSLEAVQAFCQSEGLRVPDAAKMMERDKRSERSMSPADETFLRQAVESLTGQYLAGIMARQSDYFEAFLREELSHFVERVAERVVDQVVERLTERFAGPMERPERAERSTPALASPKAAVLTRLRAMQAEGLSLQAMANRFNKEGVPTLSGKGRWQKGTIGNLLKESV